MPMTRQQSAMSTAMTAACDAAWDSRFGPEPAAHCSGSRSAQPPAPECSPQNQTHCSSAATDKLGSELGCLRRQLSQRCLRLVLGPRRPPCLRLSPSSPNWQFSLKVAIVVCEIAFEVPSALRSRAFRDVDLPPWLQQKQDASCLSYIVITNRPLHSLTTQSCPGHCGPSACLFSQVPRPCACATSTPTPTRSSPWPRNHTTTAAMAASLTSSRTRRRTARTPTSQTSRCWCSRLSWRWCA
jgi:hypothetical protein